jgi:hypothetical protein
VRSKMRNTTHQTGSGPICVAPLAALSQANPGPDTPGIMYGRNMFRPYFHDRCPKGIPAAKQHPSTGLLRSLSAIPHPAASQPSLAGRPWAVAAMWIWDDLSHERAAVVRQNPQFAQGQSLACAEQTEHRPYRIGASAGGAMPARRDPNAGMAIWSVRR